MNKLNALLILLTGLLLAACGDPTATPPGTQPAPPGTAPGFNFSVTATPAAANVPQGGSTTTTVRAWRTAGTSSTVDFSLTSLPTGVTASPSTWSWWVGDQNRSVTFQVGGNTPLGTHTITIRGTGGGIIREATFTLTVIAPLSFTVNTTTDTIDVNPGDRTCADATGSCSLRAAVMEANALRTPTVISIPAGTYRLTHTSPVDEQGGDLDLISNITLRGADRATTILDGNNTSDVIQVHSATTATLENLTIRNARDAWGYAGVHNDGTLFLSNSVVRDNRTGVSGGWWGRTTITNSIVSNNGTGFSGGDTTTITNSTLSNNLGTGVSARGTTTITNSSVSSNGGVGSYISAWADNTAIINSTVSNNRGTGVRARATTTIINSTLSGNTTTGSGGGIVSSGTLNISFSTITGNTAASGGGLDIWSGTTRLRGVILAGNTATAGTGPECQGSITSNGFNLIRSTADCTYTHVPTDILNQDAALGPLADNGGPVQTHLPNPGSPVLDRVPAAECTAIGGSPVSTDARGISRPPGANCDIGAVERQP